MEPGCNRYRRHAFTSIKRARLYGVLCTNLPCAAFGRAKLLILLPVFRDLAASGMMAQALDLDADADGFRDSGELFHTDPRHAHPCIFQT